MKAIQNYVESTQCTVILNITWKINMYGWNCLKSTHCLSRVDIVLEFQTKDQYDSFFAFYYLDVLKQLDASDCP